MVALKTVCLKRLGGDRAGEERVGRFFANEKVTAKIIAGWGALTGAACAGRHVLAIDDTSETKFPTTAQRRRGLGPTKKGNAYGVLVHAMVAVDAIGGACLGLVGGAVWNRPGVNPIPHCERPPEERESMRWLNAAAQAKLVLRPAAMVTVVDDRESDFYAKWASVPQVGFHMLTRTMQDRRLATGGMLFATAADFPVAGTRKVELPARDPGKPKRAAVVELRYGEVEICRPRQEQDRSLPKTVRLRVVQAQEIDPPTDVEPLHWRLLTTHEIAPRLRRGRLYGSGMADRWLVPASLGHRAIVPSDEIPGAATGRQPDGHGGTSGEACGGGREGGLHRYSVDPGAGRQASASGLDRVYGAGNGHHRGARPDARR